MTGGAFLVKNAKKIGSFRSRTPHPAATEGLLWGHPMLVLGALCSFLEPFCGQLSPKIDKVSEELTLRYPHEGPWVVLRFRGGEWATRAVGRAGPPPLLPSTNPLEVL